MLQLASGKSKELMIILIVIIGGLSTAAYLYNVDKYSLTYYGDSASHLVGARKVVDWMDPGLNQIGTVWLPLPHFLLLPFSLIDPLFTTGFAGLAVSLPSLAITSALLYRMIRSHIGISSIALVGAFLYASNPNIMYLGITAMTEAPFMLFFVVSAYYLQKWYHNLDTTNNLHYLVGCSIFVSLATLCRYEGWVIPIFVIFFTVTSIVRKKIDVKHKAYAVLISALSLSGVAIWLIWNAYQYNDPLEFANAQYYSAASQALARSNRENLFLQPLNVASTYGITALAMYGPVLLAAAILGYILHRRFEGRQKRSKLYICLALPPVFTVITLILGIAEMTQWFNARFLILLSPLIILLVSIYIIKFPERIRRNNLAVAGIIGSLFLFQLATPAFGVVTFLDAKNGFFWKQNPFAAQAGEALGSFYDGGNIFILTGSAQEHRIMLSSGIALRQFDEIIESSTWKASFKEPWLYDKWVVISNEPDSDAVSTSKYWTDRQETLNEHFDTIYGNQYYKIMKLK